MSGAASSPAERLKQLAPVAVIGVDRAGGGQTPAKVLAEVARAAVLGRAGRRPAPVAAQVTPCPADKTPAASPAATAMLDRLLNDPDAGMIEEWADLARARGRRVADASVPTLINWWARQPRRAESVFAVMGERGRWLASLNADWRKPVAASAIPANADEVWTTGTGPERAALLLTVRRHDAPRALALVQSTWSSDGADERRKFIDALSEGRSMADEPFLESALDDRSKTVRRAAAEVLARIAGSRLKARMTQLARGIIEVEKQRKGVLRRESVKITLNMPKDFEAAWERDGIEEQPSGGKGKRAWWTHQILRDGDLSIWTELTGLEPPSVLESIEKDNIDDVTNAITHAAVMSGDAAWSVALLRSLLKGGRKQLLEAQGLWTALKDQEREPLMIEVLDADGFSPADRWNLLAAVDAPWSLPFSLKAMKTVEKQAPSKKIDAWPLGASLDQLTRRISPKALDAFEQAMAATFGEDNTPSIQRVIDRLRLRAEIHKEFERE